MLTEEEIAALVAKLAETETQRDDSIKGIAALKAKNDELLGEKKTAQAKAKEEAEAARVAMEEAARKGGDTAALDKSWGEKYAKRGAEMDESLKARDAQLYDLTVNAEARRIAGELALPGSADVLLPHLKARLSYHDGKVVVLDAEGKPSASTVAELSAEFSSDKRFAPLIAATHATGGGASGGGKGGGAAVNPFAKGEHFNMTEQARLIRENPQQAEKLKQAASR